MPKIITGNKGVSKAGLQGSLPKWTKITKTYSDFSIAALTNSIEILSLPAKGVIHAVKLKHSTLFSGGTITTYTISIGIVGSLAKYITASNVKATVGDLVQYVSSTLGTEGNAAVTSIKATAISTLDNLDEATQGSVDIWILYSVLP